MTQAHKRWPGALPAVLTTSPNMARKTTTPKAGRRRHFMSRTQNTARVSPRRHILRILGGCLLAVALQILVLRWLPPPSTMFMLLRHVERLTETKPSPPIRYDWVPMRSIPGHMALAAVAAEDQSFPRHFGFDLDAIARAVEHNEKRGRIRGASTISQQTAKNLFLWPGRSWVRKGLEAGLTVLLELLWPKERILEVYLNIAEFGDGTYGVGAAAGRFFGKTPDRLSRHEAAILVSVLPNPRRLSAQRPSPYVMQRANWVLSQMRQLGPDYLNRR